MEVAKGRSYPDGTYVYKCGKCGGRNPNCDWCYGGDFIKVRDALKQGRRGQTYYALLKEFLRIAGKDMVSEATALKGAFTPVEIGFISLRFGLNFKATWEWLNECGKVKPYRDPRKYRHKVADIYDRAKAKYGEIAQWNGVREE